MTGQLVFFASGPLEASGNMLSTNTGNLGSVAQPYANIYASGTGTITNLTSNSGVFNYLKPTGKFFPPIVSPSMRTGLYSGLVSPAVTAFDGLMCFETGAGQKLMIVQSGVWKTVTIT